MMDIHETKNTVLRLIKALNREIKTFESAKYQ